MDTERSSGSWRMNWTSDRHPARPLRSARSCVGIASIWARNASSEMQSSPDPCGSLQAWQRKHFAPSQSPVNLDAVTDKGLTAAEDKITIAARRMHALGVSAGAAQRFTGDGMFRGVGLSLF
jgi:hypothetical protein